MGVAGLILMAALYPDKEWYELDLGEVAVPDRSRYPSLHFPPVGPTEAHNGSINDYLTEPGNSRMDLRKYGGHRSGCGAILLRSHGPRKLACFGRITERVDSLQAVEQGVDSKGRPELQCWF